MSANTESVSTKAAAEACGTTPRLLRQFLRASKDYVAVGSGGRYAFEADDLPEMKTRFRTWLADREAAAKARAEKAAQDAKADATPQPENDGADEDIVEVKDEPAKPVRGRKAAAA
ncbi:hypothetical protein [Pseudonocardia sp. WMMC193]|uniref:hypothetical protein n=1 Tax=Pseudonocardia sp. WMMC193 TaxID=2911965 RepID=UPI001F42848C|nr:hypothetical protein [Pseudonocardia sp. WMMC193]MCF7552219.1 hypothetical protein [Pseudonocardia sp. WMMC193]